LEDNSILYNYLLVLEEQQLSQYKFIGKRIARVDAIEKACGKAIFAGDLKFDKMLVGKVLRSPYAHAKIVNIDISEAKLLPGVKAILTAKDIPNNNKYNWANDAEVLASEKVRYIGDEVVILAAVNEDVAQKALELIRVEYEPLPVFTEYEQAMSSETERIHGDKPNNIAVKINVERGDIDKAFNDAKVIISNKYRIPTVHQSPIELNCAIAYFQMNKLTVYYGSQIYHQLKMQIAKIFNLREKNVVIKAVEIGGAFGSRNEQIVPILAAALALHTEHPVKIEITREEEFVAARPAMDMDIELSIATDEKGNFMGKKVYITASDGAYTSFGDAVLFIAAFRADTLYRFKNVKILAHAVYLNKPPTSAYRGFGSPQMHFAQESLIDELAERLNMDPTELRLKNFIHPGDISIHGYQINSCGIAECMKKAKELSDWQTKKQNKTFGTGIGVAALVHASGSRAGAPWFSGGSSTIIVDMFGGINVYVGESELGQGARTVFSQICAEELCCEIEDINVVIGNTDMTSFSWGTHGSKLTHILGKAVMIASRNVRDQIMDFAKKYLKINELNLEDSVFKDKKGNRLATFLEVVKRGCEENNGASFIGIGSYDTGAIVPDDGFGNVAPAYLFGVQIAEVSVNPSTGKIIVDKITSVHDVGKAINPQMIEGQVEGGVVQGLGMGLMEQLVTDRSGVVYNNSFLEYKLPTIYEIPKIQVGIVESIEPNGPYGAKGVGEPPIISVTPAIANAVYNAVGIRIREFPITPTRLHKLLNKKRVLYFKKKGN